MILLVNPPLRYWLFYRWDWLFVDGWWGGAGCRRLLVLYMILLVNPPLRYWLVLPMGWVVCRWLVGWGGLSQIVGFVYDIVGEPALTVLVVL
jgi:hypothetical protein